MIRSQKAPPATEVLNQILHLLCRGLPAYVVEINAWTRPAAAALREALARLMEDRRLYAQRTAQAILDRGGYPDPGSFPLEYTSLNDVSIEYLTDELIASLQMDIEILEALSSQLDDAPELKALAEEIIGNTKAHAEIIEETSRYEG
jgi:hypothetical protein